jgi:hypothetical protein
LALGYAHRVQSYQGERLLQGLEAEIPSRWATLAARHVPDFGVGERIHKGTNGRWRDELSAADRRLYEKTARRELGQECANWLASGSRKAAFLSGVLAVGTPIADSV